MELYGFYINEKSESMMKKAYYCKVHADLEALVPKLQYYNMFYSKKGSILQALNDAFEDRKKVMQPAIVYISEQLIAHKVYSYTEEDILELCDTIGGHFLDAFLELCDDFFEITDQEEDMRELRELRKNARTHIGAIGSGVPSLAVAAVEAGAINAATGMVHSIINIFGNAISAFERMDCLQSMYECDDTWGLLQKGIQNDCRCMDKVLSILLSDALGNGWQYPFSEEKKKEIKKYAINIRDGKIPRKEWARILVTNIINDAPYWPELYIYVEAILGEDHGNLLRTAEFFSVYPFIEKCEQKRQAALQEKRSKALQSNFWHEKQEEAEDFLFNSGVWDTLYREVDGRITPDFDYMISILNGERHFYINGKEHGPIFQNNARRHLIFFAFDFSLMQKEKEIERYCKLCHVQLKPGEKPYYFLDTTNFCTRKSGIVATNYGFYLSNPKKMNPLYYENITSMRCGMLNSMDIFYNGEDAKVDLPPVEQINNMLVFTCMYFKYGTFYKGAE